MTTKHWIDISVVVVYLVLTFVFGAFASRWLRDKKQSNSEEGYFLAGRKMPTWLNGVSLAVTALNSNVGPTYCGLAAVIGLSVCWYYMSIFSFSLLFSAFVFAAKWRQIGVATGPELAKMRYGSSHAKVIRTYQAAYMTSMILIPYIGVGLLGIHVIIGPIFGIEDKTVTLMIVLPALLIYLWIAGYAGVVVTDFIQTLVIIFSGLVLGVMVLLKFGSPSAIAENIRLLHDSNADQILSLTPSFGHTVFSPLTALVFLCIYSLGAGGGIALDGQRILSCKTPKEATKVGIWAMAALFMMLLVITIPTLGSLIDHPEFYHASPEERETIYATMLSDYLPVGMLGLALAAISASVMSSVDSILNYSSQLIVNDLCRPFFKTLSEKRGVLIGRLSMFVVLAFSLVIFYQSRSLFGILLTVAGLFAPAALIGWGQWWWWRVNFWAWITATFGGPVIFLTIGNFLNHIPWWQQHMELGGSVAHQLDALKVVISMGITTVLWITVALLTKPEDMETLKEFYIKARPDGFWGPVRKALEQDNVHLEHRRFVILSGFVAVIPVAGWINLSILALSALFIGSYLKAFLLLGAAIPTALIARKVYNWHIERMGLA